MAIAIPGCKLKALLWCYKTSWHHELEDGIVRGKRTGSEVGMERGGS